MRSEQPVVIGHGSGSRRVAQPIGIQDQAFLRLNRIASLYCNEPDSELFPELPKTGLSKRISIEENHGPEAFARGSSKELRVRYVSSLKSDELDSGGSVISQCLRKNGVHEEPHR